MHYAYMQSAGNSFAVVDGRGEIGDFSALSQKLCRKCNADGFMALGESENADFRLHFYNRDGSRAAMCGNGCRCICRFAYELGLVGENMTVQTDGGIVYGRRISRNLYQIALPAPEEIHKIGHRVDACLCGVPHAVVRTAELQKEKLYPMARELRFRLNSNVNFYMPLAPDRVAVLTYERGVENFTPACGTGCCAVAAVLDFSGKLFGKRLTAENQGGELAMEMGENCIYQTGNTEYI